MDWRTLSGGWGVGDTEGNGPVKPPRRWIAHAPHAADAIAAPHRPRPHPGSRSRGEIRTVSTSGPASLSLSDSPPRLVTLDGSRGEGGGQILRTALTLSLLTGRPFRIVKIRANRDRPGLRPQHLRAVTGAAELGHATVIGASVGSRDLTFRPSAYTPGDLQIEIGTAGSTALVLQTLHLAVALRCDRPVRLALSGGTFNPSAPSFPFLDTTWRAHLAALGAPIALAMPRAGFYPRGGGLLDAWIEPAQLRPLALTDRGPLVKIRGVAGVAHLNPSIAERMRARALDRLADCGLAAEAEVEVEITPADWPALPHVQGAALTLTAESARGAPATFIGLGERGKPAEAVADEAVAELLDFLAAPAGAVDPHSADQILLPLALAPGRSEYTVTAVTEHLRTNVATLRAFLDRDIRLEEPTDDRPGRVVVA
jgi:RNA 3'-terminal phosphate cyclase (ATP)